jgi:hypothetical protein
MAELSERHEVRLRGKDRTITFIADSDDGRLVIRQESEGKKAKDVCAITLSNPDELRAFFKGLRRMMVALGVSVEADARLPAKPKPLAAPPAVDEEARERERESLIADARQRNAQAFAPWSKAESRKFAGVTRPAKPSRPLPARISARGVLSNCVCNGSGSCPPLRRFCGGATKS